MTSPNPIPRGTTGRDLTQTRDELEGLTNTRTRLVGARTGVLADTVIALVRVGRFLGSNIARGFSRVAAVVTPLGWVILALIPMIVLMRIQRREEARVAAAAARARATPWMNPTTLSLGLQAARMVGKNRGLAAGAVGAVLLGWMVSQFMGGKSDENEEDKNA